jgi:hypothetical protein
LSLFESSNRFSSSGFLKNANVYYLVLLDLWLQSIATGSPHSFNIFGSKKVTRPLVIHIVAPPSSFQIIPDKSTLQYLTGCDGCDGCKRGVATEPTLSVATAATVAMLSFATEKTWLVATVAMLSFAISLVATVAILDIATVATG